MGAVLAAQIYKLSNLNKSHKPLPGKTKGSGMEAFCFKKINNVETGCC